MSPNMQTAKDNYETEYPLELCFQIPCFFNVRPQIFPMPIYVIGDYNRHKTDFADLSKFQYIPCVFPVF